MPSNNSSATLSMVTTTRTATAENVFYIASFITMFLTFIVGGGANAYALMKIRSCWRVNPMLCNLSVVGILACLVAGPAQIINMLGLHPVGTDPVILYQIAESLWVAVEFPLCISLVTISIQRRRTVFATFGKKPSAMMEFIAISVSWISWIPQCIMLNHAFADCDGSSIPDFDADVTHHEGLKNVGETTTSTDLSRSHTLSKLEVKMTGWRPEHTTLVLVVGTAGLMLTAYMSSLWFLKYKAYKHPSTRRQSVIHLDRISTSRRHSMKGYRAQHCSVVKQSTVEETTVTYMLAKQALMLHGWTRSGVSTTQGTMLEPPAPSVERNVPAPISHEWERSISGPRRRSSLDVSTIYSLRQKEKRGEVHGHNAQIIGRFSLPGCISPETEDFSTEPLTESIKHHQWRLQHSYRAHRMPFLGDNDNFAENRISEESMIHPGSPWADKISPSFNLSTSSDPFNDAGKGYAERSNRLSPYLDTRVFSMSSLSSEGESVGELSIVSISSNKSLRRGSKPNDKVVKTLKTMCMSTVTSSEDIYCDKRTSNKVSVAMQTCPVQGKEHKEESDKDQTTADDKHTMGQSTLEEPKKKKAQDTLSPKKELGRKRTVSNRSRKKQRSRTMNKELENPSPSWRTETSSAFNLPPLRHERLNASGMPFTLDQGSGVSEPTTCLGKISEVENTTKHSMGSNVSVTERTSSGKTLKNLSAQTTSQVFFGSIADATEQKRHSSGLLRKGSQPSRVDIFQFLAEDEDSKSQRMLKCSNSSSTQIQKRHSFQTDPTVMRTLAVSPYPQSRFSLPARISSNVDRQNAPRLAADARARRHARFTTKHDGAYHAGVKVAWLMTYYFIAMVPLAIYKVAFPVYRECSQGVVFPRNAFQALAFLCFIINPFAYVLSNKNLLNGRSRVGGMRCTLTTRGL